MRVCANKDVDTLWHDSVFNSQDVAGGEKIHEMEMIMGSVYGVVSEANILKDYQGLKSSKCTEAVY